MKFSSTSSILAIGLILGSPLAVANCKLSKPASVSPFSTSSVPSSSSSPAAAVSTNLVQNGDFADDSSYWSLTGANSFINLCVNTAVSFDATVSSDYITPFLKP
ncbi:hypothetical protein SEUCBS140593_001657 [Sporothrix eucalyptigena]|uniref:Uncharacterized protein n=1 Tax=Sporothrix eucalyptigena TaxID=1812306 RepID=A0ABP0B033_9PEZI